MARPYPICAVCARVSDGCLTMTNREAYWEREPAGGDGREAEEDEDDLVRGREERKRGAGEAQRADERVGEQRARGRRHRRGRDDNDLGELGVVRAAIGRRRARERDRRERGDDLGGHRLAQCEPAVDDGEQRDERRDRAREEVRPVAPELVVEERGVLRGRVRERAAEQRAGTRRVRIHHARKAARQARTR
jgi:hypothetical protein